MTQTLVAWRHDKADGLYRLLIGVPVIDDVDTGVLDANERPIKRNVVVMVEGAQDIVFVDEEFGEQDEAKVVEQLVKRVEKAWGEKVARGLPANVADPLRFVRQ